MTIGGLQKTTLLDYPGKISTCIFLSGCNFCCPFCHNSSLIPKNIKGLFSPEEILSLLEKRKSILDGVCISGGEPTLQEDLPEFIRDIKKLGYLVKLDTNGTNPKMLSFLISEKLIDAVAMDIKNSKEKYARTCGITDQVLPLPAILSSVDLLKNTTDLYIEFRTTVIREFHHASDFESIGEWLLGASRYVLQPFKNSDSVPLQKLHAPDCTDLKYYQKLCQNYIPSVSIRGT